MILKWFWNDFEKIEIWILVTNDCENKEYNECVKKETGYGVKFENRWCKILNYFFVKKKKWFKK